MCEQAPFDGLCGVICTDAVRLVAADPAWDADWQALQMAEAMLGDFRSVMDAVRCWTRACEGFGLGWSMMQCITGRAEAARFCTICFRQRRCIFAVRYGTYWRRCGAAQRLVAAQCGQRAKRRQDMERQGKKNVCHKKVASGEWICWRHGAAQRHAVPPACWHSDHTTPHRSAPQQSRAVLIYGSQLGRCARALRRDC